MTKDERYKYLNDDDDIDAKLLQAKKVLEAIQIENEEKKKEYLEVKKQIERERKKQAKTISQKPLKAVLYITLLLIILLAVSGFYIRYRYETSGTQIAEERLYICHTPDCKYSKKINHEKIIFFHGIAEAYKHGYQICPLCHKTLKIKLSSYSPNKHINDRIELKY